MTDQVPLNDRRARYQATAGQDEYDIDFPLETLPDDSPFTPEDLVNVYINGAADPLDTDDYTVDIEDLLVTLDPAVAAEILDGDIVALEGNSPRQRTDGYPLRGGLSSALLNFDMNKIFRILQEMTRDVGRALILNRAEDSDVSPSLPLKDEGKALIWGANGLENSDDNFNEIVADATAAKTAAETAQGLAEDARDDAITAKTAAETARGGAEAAQSAAVTAQAASEDARDDAITAKTAAETAQGLAEDARDDAITAKTAAETAQGLSEDARDDAITAKTDAQTAQAAAEAARDIAKAAGGFTYTYDSATGASDPGAGKLRFNNATIASATALYISETTGGAQAIAAELATWDDSTSTIKTKLRLFKQSDPSIFALFNVTGSLTDNGSWDTLTVAYVTGSGVISNNDVLTVQPLRTGDQGATGAAGSLPIAEGGGTVDAITADFSPDVTLADNVLVSVVSAGPNTVTNPTLNTDGSGALTIKARGNTALVAGDTGTAGYTMQLRYEATGPYWELQNPAKTRLQDIPSNTTILDGGTVGGTANAITLTPTQALAAYAAKTTYSFIPASTNTSGTVTAAVSGLSTRNVKKNIGGGVVLLAIGDIVANKPAIIYDDGTQFILMNPQTYGQGADIASASTVNLDTATGDYNNITGTTQINAITLAQGQERTVQFSGALTLANGASLILPGGANITTAAGDCAKFRGEASGVVRCVMYTKANGQAVIGGLGGGTTTAGGSSITLTAADISTNKVQLFPASAPGLYMKMPDATTLATAGAPAFVIRNTGTYPFVVVDGGTPAQAIAYLNPGEGCMVYCGDKSTAKGKWYAGAGDMGNMTEILNGAASTAVQVSAVGAAGGNGCSAYISETKFLWIWVDTTATATLKCAVVSISDAHSLSAGSAATIVTAAAIASGWFAACAMDASNVCVAYSYTSVNSAIVIGISGTSANPGSAQSVVAATSGNLHLFKISTTSAFYGYVNSTSAKGVVLSSMSTAGITVNSITTCRASTVTHGNLSIAQGDVNTYIYATVGTSSFLDHQLVTVSGTTVTANTALANQSASVVCGGCCTIALSPSFFLTVYMINSSTKLHYTTLRVSTGTTLEVLVVGNGASSVDGAGSYRIPSGGATATSMVGFLILGSYAVLIYVETSYYQHTYDFFKFDAVKRSVSYSHTVRGDMWYNVPQYNANTRQMINKVSEGKYAAGMMPLSGTTTNNVGILHGITNP